MMLVPARLALRSNAFTGEDEPSMLQLYTLVAVTMPIMVSVSHVQNAMVSVPGRVADWDGRFNSKLRICSAFFERTASSFVLGLTMAFSALRWGIFSFTRPDAVSTIVMLVPSHAQIALSDCMVRPLKPMAAAGMPIVCS